MAWNDFKVIGPQDDLWPSSTVARPERKVRTYLKAFDAKTPAGRRTFLEAIFDLCDLSARVWYRMILRPSKVKLVEIY